MQTLPIHDAGTLAYQPAWDLQLQLHAQVEAGQYPNGIIMLVEHPPVVTLGRRIGSNDHLLVSKSYLEKNGIELIETDRGGDITFHGPGQIVAYPIIPLNHYGLNLHAYMRLLEKAVIQTLAEYNITGHREEGATGVWVQHENTDAKVCAMGVKFRRWISLHGLALNVTTDLRYFELINPCGLSRPVTSLQKLLGKNCPSLPHVKTTLIKTLSTQFTK